MEVIFHRAESCFWPFSRHYSLLKPHSSGHGEALSLRPHECWKRSSPWLQDTWAPSSEAGVRGGLGFGERWSPVHAENCSVPQSADTLNTLRLRCKKEMSGLDLLTLMHRLRGTAFKGENPCSKRKENCSMVKGNLNKIPFWKEFKKIIFLLCFCLSSSGL